MEPDPGDDMPDPTIDELLRQMQKYLDADRARDLTDAELVRRFAANRDEVAFALLLERHGRLVLGVCRRALGAGADAEDAFQATFLVLVRRAPSLIQWGSLANWLHTVAGRVAARVRSRSLRQHSRERPFGDAPEPATEPAEPDTDLRRVLDEELSGLPAKYRMPLLLCYLEGRTTAEAAAELGWPTGTVSGRIARAREMLARRLTRRGVTLPAGGLSVVLSADPVSASLILSTVRLAQGLPGGVATGVHAIVASTVRGFALKRAKVAAVVLGSLTLLGSMVLVGLGSGAGPTPDPDPVPPRPPAAPAEPVVRLPRGAVVRLGNANLRHGDLRAVVFAPDGKTLASAGAGGVIVWDRDTGREVHRFPTPNSAGAVAFSHDGSLVGTAAGDVFVWETRTGRLVRQVTVEAADVERALAFSPDARTVVRVGDSGMRSWDLTAGAERARPEKLPKEFRLTGEASFTPDGDRVAFLGCNAPARVVDLRSGAVRELLKSPKEHDGGGVCLSADGKRLAAAIDATILVFDPSTGKELRAIPTKFGEAPRHLAFSADAKYIAALGYSGPSRHTNVKPRLLFFLYDAATGAELRELSLESAANEDPIDPRHIAFSPDGAVLAGWSGSVIHLWHTATGRRLHAGGNYSPVEVARFAGDGKLVATKSAYTNLVRVWDAATGAELYAVPGRFGDLSPDGQLLLTPGSTSGSLQLWEARTGRRLESWSAHTGEEDGRDASRAEFTPDGKHILSVGAEGIYGCGGTVALWSVATRKALRRSDPVGNAKAWSADASRLLAENSQFGTPLYRKLFVWDLGLGKPAGAKGKLGELQIVPRDPAVLSPDGKRLAVADYATKVLGVWDVETGERVHVLMEKVEWGATIVWSADGKRLASSSQGEDLVRLWDATSGRMIGQHKSGQGPWPKPTFSPDGKRLATTGADATTIIWDLAEVCEKAPPK
jgi:RNA polymerase sigma factor (sigma-70 family)